MRKENWEKEGKNKQEGKRIAENGEQKFLRLIPKPHQYANTT